MTSPLCGPLWRTRPCGGSSRAGRGGRGRIRRGRPPQPKPRRPDRDQGSNPEPVQVRGGRGDGSRRESVRAQATGVDGTHTRRCRRRAPGGSRRAAARRDRRSDRVRRPRASAAPRRRRTCRTTTPAASDHGSDGASTPSAGDATTATGTRPRPAAPSAACTRSCWPVWRSTAPDSGVVAVSRCTTARTCMSPSSPTLEELGVEPRHLRIYKVAAEREAGLVEQLVMPLLKQRNPAARHARRSRRQRSSRTRRGAARSSAAPRAGTPRWPPEDVLTRDRRRWTCRPRG